MVIEMAQNSEEGLDTLSGRFCKLRVGLSMVIEKAQNSEEGLDRLSGLEDNVAHEILRSFSMDELARLSTLSKGCQRLCRTLPYLTIDNKAHRFLLHSPPQIQRNQWIDALLNWHSQHGVHTRSLCFRWSLQKTTYDEQLYLDKWLSHIPHLQVQELEFEVTHHKYKKGYQFDPAVLNFKSLTSLALNLHWAHIKLPSSLAADSPMLARLTLKCTNINDKFLATLVSQCKCLNFLLVKNCYGLKHVSIVSSSLKQLGLVFTEYGSCENVTISADKLHTLGITWFPYSDGSFTIYVPELKRLYWAGTPFGSFQCTGRFPHLRDSRLNIYRYDVSYDSVIKALDNLVYSVGHSSSLQTCLFSVELLVKCTNLPYAFLHVSSLVMSTNRLDDYQVPLLADFLQETPHLKHLTITFDWKLKRYIYKTACKVVMDDDDDDDDDDDGVDTLDDDDGVDTLDDDDDDDNLDARYWESRNLVFIRHLQTLEMEIFKWGNEVELLKFLLKNAENLHSVTVYYSAPFLEDSSQEIRECKRASTELRFLARKK